VGGEMHGYRLLLAVFPFGQLLYPAGVQGVAAGVRGAARGRARFKEDGESGR